MDRPRLCHIQLQDSRLIVPDFTVPGFFRRQGLRDDDLDAVSRAFGVFCSLFLLISAPSSVNYIAGCCFSVLF